ncbi:MAG: hypothetical protein UZ22_OP11002000711 [Microgenomates bacterium OLB23]|nr:MAG: hypothetical protein UZ22_OP11002000711 [Microgenomates bacterium OLB23]
MGVRLYVYIGSNTNTNLSVYFILFECFRNVYTILYIVMGEFSINQFTG